MKNIYCLLSCFFLLALASCTNEIESEISNEPPVITPPVVIVDSVTVAFKFTGDVDFSTSPLNTRTSASDLYGLQVYTMTTGTSNDVNRYAYGYFDDIDAIKVRLSTIQKYGFTLTYIPNGKNIIYRYPSGHYGRPFASLFQDAYNGAINTLNYSTAAGLDQLGSCSAQTTSETNVDNAFIEVERYQGAVYYINPKESNIIEIPLYKQMFGLKIVAKDFTEGSVFIKSVHGSVRHSFKPTSGTSTTEHSWIFQMPNMPDCYSHDRELSQNINIGIFYKDKSGIETPMFSKLITVERNVMHTFTFSVGDILYGGIHPTLNEDEDMEEKEQLEQ